MTSTKTTTRQTKYRKRREGCPKYWADGFIVYKRGTVAASPRDVPVNLTSEQWRQVDKLLSDGHVLGFLANETDALSAIIEIIRRCDVAIDVMYDADALVLYVSRKVERTRQH